LGGRDPCNPCGVDAYVYKVGPPYRNVTRDLRDFAVSVVCLARETANTQYIFFSFCVLSLDVKCFCVCAVMPVSANGLGISLGFTRFSK